MSWTGRRHASWCHSESLRIDAAGERGFIRSLLRELDVMTEP